MISGHSLPPPSPPLPLPPAWNVRPTAIGDNCGPIGACDSGPYLAPSTLLLPPSPPLVYYTNYRGGNAQFMHVVGPPGWMSLPLPQARPHTGVEGGGAEQRFKMLLHQKKPAGYLSISLAATRPRAKRGQN